MSISNDPPPIAAPTQGDASQKSVHEVLARAVTDPSGILKVLGEPKRPEIQKLYHAPDLTIVDMVWGPMMTVMSHDRRMWAAIGSSRAARTTCLAPFARW